MHVSELVYAVRKIGWVDVSLGKVEQEEEVVAVYRWWLCTGEVLKTIQGLPCLCGTVKIWKG